MKGIFHKSTVRVTVLCCMLAVYFCVICFLNFSSVPSFYDGDMYCDYRYAMEAWTHKSIFPEGWVFGNQLNAVSTPVLAALIYGLSQNMNFSMAAACVIMAVLVMVCYDWMIRDVLKDMESRLVAGVLLVTASLYCGRAVHGNQGWTLLFTMCSYYAGYSITAFLAFGCYLRGISGNLKKQWSAAAVACILSFGTGIQSIRQTAIMVAPILAAEFLRLVGSFRSWKQNRNPLWIAAGITASNFLGLLYVRMQEINQNQIFGKIEFTSIMELKKEIGDCLYMIKDLLGADHPEALLILAVLCIISLSSIACIAINAKQEKNVGALVLTFLLGASVAVIVAIDIFTSMFIRPRYYFMLYPLFGFLIAYVYHKVRKSKNGLLIFTVVFFCLSCVGELTGVCRSAVNRAEEESYAISEYLLDNGYTTIYAVWSKGNDIAVASNNRISVGFWHKENTFEKVTYLCNLDVYLAEPTECVYLFAGEDALESGKQVAESLDVSLEMIRYFPKSDTYICEASENLMQMIR